MRRKLFAAGVLFLLVLTIQAGTVSAQELSKGSEAVWDDMLKALSTEDWDTAFKDASKLRENLPANDTKKLTEKLRYMYLYSAAGRVLSGSMSYDELDKIVKTEVGKQIIFPFRPVTDDCQTAFNFICADHFKDKKLMVTASNRTATTILAFEYLTFRQDPGLRKYVGRYISLSGKVTAITPNPNRSNLIILRIYVEDALVFHVLDEEKESVAAITAPIRLGPVYNR